ncbi:MAG: precorrin-2 C(20)-methyltransferase [Bacillota bacterium]|nr:precorrin-2 C(20)-methyltransferase [Bacillota bacterium]
MEIKKTTQKGRLIGVGVGPGDPELLTVKAIRTLEQADFIAYPTSGKQADGSEPSNLALNIVRDHVKNARLLEYLMPMSRDKEYVRKMHEECAADIKKHLDSGQTIAFITLGDPSIYSTYMYIHKIIEAAGYDTSLVPGIPSFCAAAASLNDSLCEGDEPLLIVPAGYDVLDEALDYQGNKVFMKSGRTLASLREKLEKKGLIDKTRMVVKASLPDEKTYFDMKAAPEKSSYFSLLILKN